MSDDVLSPPALAKRWKVAPDKVLALIRSGQLRAVNLAINPKGRPRYRIYISEVERFEQSRMVSPPAPRAKRRRRAETTTKEYF